jgi:pimeloyl-ACP methyl ester carboxylesterase
MRRDGVLDIPASRNDTKPSIVICPGWGEGLRGWRQTATQLAETTGRRVVVIAAPGWRQFSLRHLRPSKSLDRLADNVCRQIDRLGLAGAIGLGHSMAGVYLSKAAAQDTTRFSRLILACPAGFIDRDSFWPLAGRLFQKAGQSIIRARKQPQLRGSTRIALQEGFFYPLRNPFAVLEAIALPAARAEPFPDTLVLLAEEDSIYPRDRMVIPPGFAQKSIPGPHDPQYDAVEFSNFIAALL